MLIVDGVNPTALQMEHAFVIIIAFLGFIVERVEVFLEFIMHMWTFLSENEGTSF